MAFDRKYHARNGTTSNSERRRTIHTRAANAAAKCRRPRDVVTQERVRASPRGSPARAFTPVVLGRGLLPISLLIASISACARQQAHTAAVVAGCRLAERRWRLWVRCSGRAGRACSRTDERCFTELMTVDSASPTRPRKLIAPSFCLPVLLAR